MQRPNQRRSLAGQLVFVDTLVGVGKTSPTLKLRRRLARRFAVASLLVVSTTAVGAAPSSADDQATWSKATTCTNNSIDITYWRTPGSGTCYRNNAADRDGDLRTTGDTYNDNFKVGNLTGSAPNTHFIYNFFTATDVDFWTGTCYSGSRFTVLRNLGNLGIPSSSMNLRSLARTNINACGLP